MLKQVVFGCKQCRHNAIVKLMSTTAIRTSSDNLLNRLRDLRSEWTFANNQATRVSNLHIRVGSSGTSRQVPVSVVTDAEEGDDLAIGTDLGGYFIAIYDTMTDLIADVL